MSSKAAKKRNTGSSAIQVHPGLLEQGGESHGKYIQDDLEESSDKYHSFSTLSKNNTFLFIVITLCIIVPCLYITFHPSQPPSTPSNELQRGIEEYNHLLQRATVLIKQYKSLTNGDTLPENLILTAPNENELHNILEGKDPSKQQDINNNGAQGQRSGGTQEINAAQLQDLSQSNIKVKGDAISRKSSKRDIVLGMAQDTDPKNLAIFCESLRSVSQAIIVIFVNAPASDRAKEIASKNDVRLIEFDEDSVSDFMSAYHPSTTRWKLYDDYLRKNPKYKVLYNRIWMIDVRDSFFQSDPFEFIDPSTPSFHIFQGQEAFDIAKCGWNSGWIKDCFGETILRDVGNNKIICSGVSAGTTDVVMDYVHMMSEIVQGHSIPPPTFDPSSPTASGKIGEDGQEEDIDIIELLTERREKIKSKFPQCERNGVDQGVHNILVYKQLIPHIKRWDQSSGPVANLQAKVAEFDDSSKKITNRKHELSAVVHQYDRVPELQHHLFEKYVYWTNANDFNAEWQSEHACSQYSYRQDQDLFKGRCDLKMQGGATSAASCCRFCEKADNCHAFTYSSGVCFLKSCSSVSGAGSPLKGAVSGYKK